MNKKTIFLTLIFTFIGSQVIATDNGATWDKKSYLPFEVISSVANNRLVEWLNRPSEVKLFSLEKPKVPKVPKVPTLIKSEFESTQQFEIRVDIAQKKYNGAVNVLQRKFQKQKNNYNQAVKEYNLSLEVEKRRRKSLAESKYWEFVFEAFSIELGEPTLKLIEYNADLSVFYAILTSSRSVFSQWVSINVPLSNAKNLKENSSQALPIIRFDKNSNNELIISNISVAFGKHKYRAKLINKPADLSKVIKETLEDKKVQNIGRFLKVE